jgi:hypothetical protein
MLTPKIEKDYSKRCKNIDSIINTSCVFHFGITKTVDLHENKPAGRVSITYYRASIFLLHGYTLNSGSNLYCDSF